MSSSPVAESTAPQSSPSSTVNLGPIICPGHSRPIPDISFSNVIDGEFYLMSGGLDKKPMIRRGDTGDWIGTFEGHKGAVWSARLNSEATHVITSSGDFTAKLWDGITGDDLHTFNHRHIVKTGVFSLDSSKAFTGGHEKKVRVFDLEQPDADPQVLEGHEKQISNIVALPNNPYLIASSGDDQGIRIWDLRQAQIVKVLSTPSSVSSLEISSYPNVMVATSGSDVQFWNIENLELIRSYTRERELKCASLHPDGLAFVTGSMTELWVRLYSYETGEEIGCLKGHHGPVRSIAFSPLGHTFASGSEDGTIRIWEFTSL